MRVYFFCRQPGPPEAAGYEHGLVALAEGFRALGHEVAGNLDLWPVSGGWLIPRTEESPDSFDLAVISNESWTGPGSLPQGFTDVRGPKRVYVDLADGWRTEASTAQDWPADLVLRAHYNRKYRYPSRVRPWAFGLTNRMIAATEGNVPARVRPRTILCNFRVGHPVRDRLTTALKDSLDPSWSWDDRIDTAPPEDSTALTLWRLTGRRHNPAYYRRLGQSQGCLAFGGFFAPGLASAPSNPFGRASYKAMQRLGMTSKTLTQFDSWRFWESLAAGTATVHAPLEKWGAQFPVMPDDGYHFVSFDPQEPIAAFTERWETCLQADVGRSWAIQYYGPMAVAKRLLEML
jgi:hypothetical protein